MQSRTMILNSNGRTRLVPVEQDHWDSGEVQTRSSFKRHAKGNVSIVECDPQGKYIILENTSGSVAENVSNFEIGRVIDGVQTVVFCLPSNLVIQQHGHVKIYGRNSGGIHSPPYSIVMESHPSWGQGGQVETFLKNRNGISIASHIQYSVFLQPESTPHLASARDPPASPPAHQSHPVEQDDLDSGEYRNLWTYRRHAKGNVRIVECDPDGKFTILENTSGSVAEDVSNFEIRRVIDGVQAFIFRLPSHLVIQQHGHLKIYGRNSGEINLTPVSIVMESHPSWGQGRQVETFLYNSHGIGKASHILIDRFLQLLHPSSN